jgi:hypothetical protein
MVMSIGWFAMIGADLMWRVGAALHRVAFRSPSGLLNRPRIRRAWSCAGQAWRAV